MHMNSDSMKSEKECSLMRKALYVAAAVAAAVILVVAYKVMFGKGSKIDKEALISFHRGTGGDMQGSSSNTYLRRYDDDRALLTLSHAGWHYEDPQITEYFVDVSVMDEIKAVFCKYRMHSWDGKKFTDMFVADGASTSYDFDFETMDVSFSSQIYPERYANKLNEINAIIQRCIPEGERLPGLIMPELSEKERMAANHPEDDMVSLHVYEYSRNQLSYRFSNGTDEKTELASDYMLHKEGSDEMIAQAEAGSYTYSVYPHSRREITFQLEQRLEPGTYLLEAGGLNCRFEIGMSED